MSTAKRPREDDEGASESEPAPKAAAAPSDASAAPPPPDAASLLAAPFWYYEADGAIVHGPFSTVDMRAGYEGSYLQPTLPVAPSFYGEVPTTFWPISALWAEDVAAEQAFVSVVETPTAPVLNTGPEFIEADTFAGAREGYVFRTELYGTGYYRDTPPAIEITAADIEAEKKKRREKALAFSSHIAPTGADFREHK